MAHELREAGLKVEQQKPISVFYDNIIVGEYMADSLVEDCLLIELKTVERLGEAPSCPKPELLESYTTSALSVNKFRKAES